MINKDQLKRILQALMAAKEKGETKEALLARVPEIQERLELDADQTAQIEAFLSRLYEIKEAESKPDEESNENESEEEAESDDEESEESEAEEEAESDDEESEESEAEEEAESDDDDTDDAEEEGDFPLYVNDLYPELNAKSVKYRRKIVNLVNEQVKFLPVKIRKDFSKTYVDACYWRNGEGNWSVGVALFAEDQTATEIEFERNLSKGKGTNQWLIVFKALDKDKFLNGLSEDFSISVRDASATWLSSFDSLAAYTNIHEDDLVEFINALKEGLEIPQVEPEEEQELEIDMTALENALRAKLQPLLEDYVKNYPDERFLLIRDKLLFDFISQYWNWLGQRESWRDWKDVSVTEITEEDRKLIDDSSLEDILVDFGFIVSQFMSPHEMREFFNAGKALMHQVIRFGKYEVEFFDTFDKLSESGYIAYRDINSVIRKVLPEIQYNPKIEFSGTSSGTQEWIRMKIVDRNVRYENKYDVDPKWLMKHSDFSNKQGFICVGKMELYLAKLINQGKIELKKEDFRIYAF